MDAFFNFLENLRRKPEPLRRRILTGVVLVLMVLVVAGWLETLNFAEPAGENPETLTASPLASPPPWEVIKQTFSGGWSDLKENIQKNLEDLSRRSGDFKNAFQKSGDQNQ